MRTWTADPAVPHDAIAAAVDLRNTPGSMLPVDGARGLPMFDQTNGFIPVGVWGVDAAGNAPTGYDGLLADATVDFNHSLQYSAFGGGGGGKSKKTATDASWLKRNGFATPAEVSPSAMRAYIEAAERQLSRRPDTTLAIVLASDWRDVGDHLQKHPEKRALVAAAVAEGLPALRYAEETAPGETLEDAILAEVREAIQRAPGVQAVFNQGESTAAFEVGKNRTVVRLATLDLRLHPTVRFVAKLARDLDLKVTKATQVFVGEEEPMEAAEAKALIEFVDDVVKRATPKAKVSRKAPKYNYLTKKQ